MILPGHVCQCGNPDVFSIQPGSDAVFALPRDLFGAVDHTQKPIVIQRASADVVKCISCMPKRVVAA